MFLDWSYTDVYFIIEVKGEIFRCNKASGHCVRMEARLSVDSGSRDTVICPPVTLLDLLWTVDKQVIQQDQGNHLFFFVTWVTSLEVVTPQHLFTLFTVKNWWSNPNYYLNWHLHFTSQQPHHYVYISPDNWPMPQHINSGILFTITAGTIALSKCQYLRYYCFVMERKRRHNTSF